MVLSPHILCVNTYEPLEGGKTRYGNQTTCRCKEHLGIRKGPVFIAGAPGGIGNPAGVALSAGWADAAGRCGTVDAFPDAGNRAVCCGIWNGTLCRIPPPPVWPENRTVLRRFAVRSPAALRHCLARRRGEFSASASAPVRRCLGRCFRRTCRTPESTPVMFPFGRCKLFSPFSWNA